MQAALLQFAKYFSGIATPTVDTATHDLPIRRMSFAPEFIVPLSQHSGTPARPCVRVGQEVVRGEPIATSSGFISIAMHAPATGEVVAIEPRPNTRGEAVPSIVVRAYSGSTQEVLYRVPRNIAALSPREIVEAVQTAGIVDELVHPFPAHVKLAVPEGAQIATLIVNCCRPGYSHSSDGRLLIEHAADVHAGIAIVQRALGASNVLVAIEDDMFIAAEALLGCSMCNARTAVTVCNGANRGEKELVKEVLGKSVPKHGLAAQVGAVVFGVNTIAQIGALLPSGEGLTEQVVTISGAGVEHPGNYRVPIGTPYRFAMREAGLSDRATEIVLSGPKVSSAVVESNAPITKGVTGIVVTTQPDWHKQQKAHVSLRSRVYGGNRK